jgi:hypothetical protein
MTAKILIFEVIQFFAIISKTIYNVHTSISSLWDYTIVSGKSSICQIRD